MTTEITAKLILMASKQPDPYRCYVTLNHQTETYNLRQYHNILECETAVRLIPNNDQNLLESLRVAMQEIHLLEVN
jgi:hypothetical protein